MIALVHDWFSVSKCGWFFRVLWAWTLILSPAFGQDPQVSQETKAPPASKNTASKSVESKSGSNPGNGKSLVIVSVVEEETGQPIAKAPLKFSIFGKGASDQKIRDVITDEKGQYRAEAPIGSFIFCNPESKLGYWHIPPKDFHYLGPTAEQPVANLNIKLKRGPIWNIQVTHDNGIPGISKFDGFVKEETEDMLRAKLIKEGELTLPFLWKQFTSPTLISDVFFDQDGRGQFTQYGESGKILIFLGAKGLNDISLILDFYPVVSELVVEPKFNVKRVRSANPIPGSDQTQLVDENGAKAMVRMAKVSLQNGQPLLTFHMKRRENPKQEFFGKVVDTNGKPIPGVNVRTVLGNFVANGEQAEVTKTDSSGRFRLNTSLLVVSGSDYLKVSLTKDGYAGFDSRGFPLPKAPGEPIDVGTVTLVNGKTIPMLVVDQKNQPVSGATVSVHVDKGSPFAHRSLTLKTDDQGRGLLQNLPVGLIQIHFSHGGQKGSQSIVVSPLDSENTEIHFRFKSITKPAAINPKPVESAAPGQLAPDLAVDRWGDGKQRNLADLRGQVVVFNYWSMAWNPSVQEIPALKEVAAKYQSKGVVFLSIHSPEGDLDQIKRFQKWMDWKVPVGVDEGTAFFNGETLKRYGWRNPSIIIIDAEGKLAYHSRIPPKEASPADQEKLENENKEIAASLNIPWPLPSRDDAQSRSHRDKFHAAILGKEIEKVMAAKKK